MQQEKPGREKVALKPTRAVNEWKYSLTEHVQADFLCLLSCLVLCLADIISFIHLRDIFYYQFRTILVQAVLITRLKVDTVTVAQRKEEDEGSCHKYFA